MRAVVAGSKEFVQYLIKEGADLDKKDNYGDTALDIAKKIEDGEIVKLLVSASGSCPTDSIIQQKNFVFKNVNVFGENALYNRYDAKELDFRGQDCDINYNGTIYSEERDCLNSTHLGM